MSDFMRRFMTLALRRIRVRRTPQWRGRLSSWALANVEPLLASEKGDAHLRAVLASVVRRLNPILVFLDLGPDVLDDSRFANGLHQALNPLAFCPEITATGAKLRAYCDINASLAVFEALLREIGPELEVQEIDAAMRLAAAGGSWREPLIAAGRRMLAAGRHDEAIAYARRALDVMSSCPLSQRLLMDALRARQAAGGALSAPEENGLADLRGRFCPRPFEVIVSGQGVRWNEATGA